MPCLRRLDKRGCRQAGLRARDLSFGMSLGLDRPGHLYDGRVLSLPSITAYSLPHVAYKEKKIEGLYLCNI